MAQFMKRISTHVLDIARGYPAKDNGGATGEARVCRRVETGAFVADGCGWTVRSIAAGERDASRGALPGIVRYGELSTRARNRGVVSDCGDYLSGARGGIAISHSVAAEPARLYDVPGKLIG